MEKLVIQRKFRRKAHLSLSFVGILLIISTLIIISVPFSFCEVNTDLTLSFWLMPLIYDLNNGTAVSLSVGGHENETVETKFHVEEGCRDAVIFSYAGIIYKENQHYFNIINLKVQTENMPYATATASFNATVSLMRDESVVKHLYELKNSVRLDIPPLDFTSISKMIVDGNYTITFRGYVKYHIETVVEKVDELRELDFGCLNIMVSEQKVVYVQHGFRVFSEAKNVRNANPMLFKTKKWAPLILLPISGILQIPTIIFYLKPKTTKKLN